MQQIIIDVDELRTISTLSVESASKMDEANSVIGTVVSQHDWKCPERVAIDESLETIKANVLELSDSFNSFASEITDIANTYTEFINNQVRMNTEYMESVANLVAEFGSANGVVYGHSTGVRVSELVSSMEANSLDTANIASLHGSSCGASIVDFSQLDN